MDDKNANLGFVKTWQSSAQALQDIKIQELRKRNYADEIAVFHGLFDYACASADLKQSSGLVDMQRILNSSLLSRNENITNKDHCREKRSNNK